MKKLVYLALLAIVAVSCSKDESMPLIGNYKITGYSAVETKTQFGTPNTTSTTSGTIPFEWSAGDKIWSNGAQSGAAEIDANTGKAVFSFTTAPGSDVYYNMTGSSNQANVPAAQSIANNLGANGDFGYATVSNGSFTLEHATAYLWFNVTSSIANATLEWVKVDAADVDIAGKATWNGSAFGPVTEGSKSVTLTVGQALAATNSNVWAMVVMPANLTGKEVKVTYKLTVGGADKYYKQTLTGKALTAGKTQKITTVITESALTDYMELRVLTFEDNDYKGTGSTYWSDKIYVDPNYPGYGGGHGIISWYDEGNTELAFTPSSTAQFPGYGGHAISKFYSKDLSIIEPGSYYPLDLYVYEETAANNSNNFASHFGYLDNSGMGMMSELVYFQFKDQVARVIDHMYVANTTYVCALLTNGDGWQVPDGAGDDTWYKIVAYGYNGSIQTGTVEFYLWKEGKEFVEEWTKWELHSLGAVTRVEFNLVGSGDLYGEYGLGVAGYFAYDNVAVRF